MSIAALTAPTQVEASSCAHRRSNAACAANVSCAFCFATQTCAERSDLNLPGVCPGYAGYGCNVWNGDAAACVLHVYSPGLDAWSSDPKSCQPTDDCLACAFCYTTQRCLPHTAMATACSPPWDDLCRSYDGQQTACNVAGGAARQCTDRRDPAAVAAVECGRCSYCPSSRQCRNATAILRCPGWTSHCSAWTTGSPTAPVDAARCAAWNSRAPQPLPCNGTACRGYTAACEAVATSQACVAATDMCHRLALFGLPQTDACEDYVFNQTSLQFVLLRIGTAGWRECPSCVRCRHCGVTGRCTSDANFTALCLSAPDVAACDRYTSPDLCVRAGCAFCAATGACTAWNATGCALACPRYTSAATCMGRADSPCTWCAAQCRPTADCSANATSPCSLFSDLPALCSAVAGCAYCQPTAQCQPAAAYCGLCALLNTSQRACNAAATCAACSTSKSTFA